MQKLGQKWAPDSIQADGGAWQQCPCGTGFEGMKDAK